MKQIRPSFGILATTVAFAIHVQAQFTFTTNNGTIAITGYTGQGGSVTIPGITNGLPVTSIGDYAFTPPSTWIGTLPPMLTSVAIPDTITNIGEGAFAFCNWLTQVAIPQGVTTIKPQTFVACSSMTNVVIPNSVVSIGDSAFASCISLSIVTIPDSVTNIGNSTFNNCTNLSNIGISSNVVFIGDAPFYDCNSLRAINVNSANPAYSSVDGVLFNKTQSVLKQCPGAKAGSYSVPASVSYISDNAFRGCNSLTNLFIPGSVFSISFSAFYGCTRLQSILIGNNVTSIGNDSFYDCPSLMAITVDAANAFYSSVDGVLFDKSQNTLIQYPPGKAGDYTIPDSVTCIWYDSFAYSSRLTGVIIPDSVTNISGGTFSYCTDLTSVVISDSVTSIGVSAFAYCYSLNNVRISHGVTSIGDDTFYRCTSLTNVVIPNSVTNIGDGAFYLCTNVTGIWFQGDAPIVGSASFGYPAHLVLYYLPGTTGWSSSFDGFPAVLWNPQAQTTDGHFGVLGSDFGFTITGTANIPLVVEASASLANPVWMPLQSCMLTNGSIYFSDPQWTNYSSRFYRIRSP